MSAVVIKPGDSLIVAGVAWDDGWEFDCPTVLYRGFKRYTPNRSSVCVESIAGYIEDVAIDAVVAGTYEADWHPSDLREFAWRGWSTRGFARRRGVHATYRVSFKIESGELSFDLTPLIPKRAVCFGR